MRIRIVLAILALAVLSVLVFLVTRKTKDFDEAMQEVGDAIAKGDIDEALKLARAAHSVAETPEQHYGAYLAEGVLCVKHRRNAEAREALRAALAVEGIDPDKRFSVYMLIAMTWEDEEKPAEVRATYAEALKEELSSPWKCLALARLASAWHEEGKLDQANGTYAELLELAEAEAESQWITHAHSGIGDILAEQQDFAAALEAYEKALCAGGGSEAFICLNVGQALIGLKRYADAKLLLSVVVENELVPFFTRDRALMLTAEALEAEGKPAEAQQVKEQLYEDRAATDTSPESDPQADLALRIDCRVASFMAIGKFHLDQGAKDRARETFTRIVEMEGVRAEDKQKAQAYLGEMD